MKEDDLFDPEFKLVLADRLAVQFKNFAEATSWIEQEQKFYANIMAPAANQDEAVAQTWNQINNWFQQYNRQRQGHLNNSNSRSEGAKSIIEEFFNRYASGLLIYSQSTWGRYVLQLATTNPQLAARVLIMLGGMNFSLQQAATGPLWLRAGALSEALRSGWLDQKPAADLALDHFRQQWELRLQSMENALSKKIDESGAVLRGLDEEREVWHGKGASLGESSAQLIEKTERQTKEAIEKGIAEIESFKQTYNAALALRAPTQYWADKGAAHWHAAFGWLSAFAVIAAVGSLGCWFVWHETVQTIIREANYTAYLPTIGAAALAAWFLRICSRQVLSNFLLSSDASERVAMVKTYLALSEGGHATEAERGLILSALFRPSVRVTDDAAPPSWFDAITKEK